MSVQSFPYSTLIGFASQYLISVSYLLQKYSVHLNYYIFHITIEKHKCPQGGHMFVEQRMWTDTAGIVQLMVALRGSMALY